MQQLRDYQTDLTGGIFRDWKQGSKNVCGVAPTGAGKTVMMSHVIRSTGEPVIAIAHRQELVSQISLALARCGIYHGLIASDKTIKFVVSRHVKKVGRSFINQNSPVTVAGVDTLIRREGDFSRYKYWMLDEGHHALQSNKWGQVLARLTNARGCGWTATPIRADRKSLHALHGGLYTSLVNGPCMRDLIDRGYLSEYLIYGPKPSINRDMIGVSDTTGDFSSTQLRTASRNSSIVGDVVSHYIQHAFRKRTIVFATDVESASKIAVSFKNIGLRAEALSGKTDDNTRAMITDRFENGDLDILVNVDLFGEGYDVPAVECVIMGRPTESYGLYCLDPETEVLTPDGWKKYNEFETLTECFGYDIKTGKIKKTKITNYIKRKVYIGEKFYSLSAPHLNFNISDEHRLIVKSRSPKCDYKLETVTDVTNRKSMFKVPVSGVLDCPGSGLSIPELHLIGWFLSDGCINKRTNAITISQSVKKTTHLEHIEKTLNGCGLKYGKHLYKRKNVPDTHNNLYIYTISYGKPRGTDKHLRGWSHLKKWLNKSLPICYDSLTRNELLTILESINLGDGSNNHDSLKHRKKTLTINCGNNETYTDRLQALCVLRGLRCNKSKFKTWYLLNINDATYSTIPGKNIKNGKIIDSVRNRTTFYNRSRIQEVQPPDFTWCISNEFETIITRRNGKVIIMGNSQQFGRVLRTAPGKPHGIIIDAVGNARRHSLPDSPIPWTLNEPDIRKQKPRTVPTRACVNPECLLMYEGYSLKCPYCGHRAETESSPREIEQIEGDLTRYDGVLLEQLRNKAAEIMQKKHAPGHLPRPIQQKILKDIESKQEAQQNLRDAIAYWAGVRRDLHGDDDSTSYMRFWYKFGVDVLTAQTLPTREAGELYRRIWDETERDCV